MDKVPGDISWRKYQQAINNEGLSYTDLDIGAMLVEDIVDITDCGTERKRSTVKLMR